MNSEHFSELAALTWLAFTAAELDQLGFSSYSHFLVSEEHPLPQHNYYIQSSSCLTAEHSQVSTADQGPYLGTHIKWCGDDVFL